MEEFKGGTVQVANDVIDTIIAAAAYNTDGVEVVKGFDGEKLRRGHDKFLLTKVEDNCLTTSLVIVPSFTKTLSITAEEVQKNVKEQVESMLGLVCLAVNILIEK